jgi:hypothetical protein
MHSDLRRLQTSDTVSPQVEAFRTVWQVPMWATERSVVGVGFGLMVAEGWIVERKV